MENKLPAFLQPFLWSVKISSLDLKEDKIYIIHQILAYGNLKALRWLFYTYSFSTIRKVFITQPVKNYTPSAFFFAKNILLELANKNISSPKYDETTPRIIGR